MTNQIIPIRFFGFENSFKDVTLLLENYIRPEMISFKINVENFLYEGIDFYWDFFQKYHLDKKNLNILILHEPESYYPLQYKNKILKNFHLVIPIGIERAKRLNSEIYLPFIPYENSYRMHPNNIPTPFESIKFHSKSGIVMISGNKFSASNASNYGLRRRIAAQMNNDRDNLQLIGRWNLPFQDEIGNRYAAIKYALLCGNLPKLTEALSYLFFKFAVKEEHVENKLDALLPFKYCIVIENESDWVTEKIFDALKSGCIPIYIGADLNFIPKVLESSIIVPRDGNEVYSIRKIVTNFELYDVKLKNLKNLLQDFEFWESIAWDVQLKILVDNLSIQLARFKNI